MSRKKPYFPFILDYKPRFFLGWFLYRLFQRVRLNQDMVAELKQMNREGTVVYAIKYRSSLDYLLYHFRFLKGRLPFPKLAFHLNMALLLPLSDLFRVLKFHLRHLFRHGRRPDSAPFFKEALTEGVTSLFCLVDPKAFRKHYLHAQEEYLHLLLETQKDMEKPIYIVPLLVLYKKAPEKEHPTLLEIFFGFKDKPGTLRKIMLFFRHNRRAFIDFGTPVNVKMLLADQDGSHGLEETAESVRQTLIDRIDRQKRIMLGPVMKSRQQLKVKVLKDPTVLHTLKDLSSSKPSRLKSLKKEASRYFDEIAADYNIAYIEFANKVLTWVWKKMFEGIDLKDEELATVRIWARKGPLIYIPSHKSHIDYLVLNYILYQHHMHVPRVAAGRNLNFWPMGTFFRKSGAFFIRRSFKGARLYSVIFKRYIKALLQEGHPLEFFIEGGRSRSGKLTLPKIGFLSILIEAYQQGYCEDLIFVPASIVYDRIIEEKAYLKELSGNRKQGESLSQVVRARRFLKKKYGKIYIRFGSPLSINTFLQQHQEDMTSGYKGLAFDLIRSINRVTPVTPFALMAAAILTRHRRGFQWDELMGSIKAILTFFEKYRVPMASTLNRTETAMMETLAVLLDSGVINTLENVDRSETFYYLEEEKIPELAYYKNSIIHYFISHAFVALSLLAGTEEIKPPGQIRADFDFLKDVFRYEFIYDEPETDTQKMEEALAYFMDTGFIVEEGLKDQHGYRLTKPGYDALPLWAELIQPFVESYWIAARSMLQDAKREKKRSDPVKNMNYLGHRFHKQGVIHHIEAVHPLQFQNAVRLIRTDILKATDPSQDAASEGIRRLSRFSNRLHELSPKNG